MSIEVPIIVLILAFPIYFLSKWILKKWNFGNEKNRKYLAIIPSVVLSPIVYIGLIYLWIFSISYYPTNDFDKQTWESNPEERYKMSEDIIAYGLGFVPGLFNIDPDVLDIYFENGKVTKVGQHET